MVCLLYLTSYGLTRLTPYPLLPQVIIDTNKARGAVEKWLVEVRGKGGSSARIG